MINVVCLKWGKKYGPEYVNRLFAAVTRHTTKPVRFWCVTEQCQGIDPRVNIAPLKFADRLDSWWNKIMLFSPHLPIPPGQHIFYIDLDTLIVSNIDDLLTSDVPDILLLRDFYHGIARTAGGAASGLMSWQHGRYYDIWNRFIVNPEDAVRQAHPHGDQWWIEHCVQAWYYWQDLFPNRVVSFKLHCADGLPTDASVVCYHGRPTIPESVTRSMNHSTASKRWSTQPAPWVLDHWRE
jgi:hypothetical protein